MLEIGLVVVVILVCIIALGACMVSGRSGDRVDEVLKAYSDKLKQQKKDGKSNV